MNKAEELYKKVSSRLDDFDWMSVDPYFDGMGEILKDSIINGPTYRAFMVELCRFKKPRQVVELGAHLGKTTSVLLGGVSKDAKIIAVEIDENLPWLAPKDSRIIRVVGDDLDLSIYPKKVKLENTDIWFIDSNHTAEHLEAEFNLYSPFWEPGTIILLDDVLDEKITLKDYWEKIPYDKYATKDLHPPHGFGVVVI